MFVPDERYRNKGGWANADGWFATRARLARSPAVTRDYAARLAVDYFYLRLLRAAMTTDASLAELFDGSSA